MRFFTLDAKREGEEEEPRGSKEVPKEVPVRESLHSILHEEYLEYKEQAQKATEAHFEKYSEKIKTEVLALLHDAVYSTNRECQIWTPGLTGWDDKIPNIPSQFEAYFDFLWHWLHYEGLSVYRTKTAEGNSKILVTVEGWSRREKT